MIAMHFTLTRQMPPAAGMMALLGLAVVVGAVSQIYLANILTYPMEWFDAIAYELEVMLASVLHLVGFYSELPWPTPSRIARSIDVGVFGGLLYIASEVLYVIAVAVVATRQATQSGSAPSAKVPKKLISFYLVMGLIYTFSFFYLGVFIAGIASTYEMAFSMILNADSIQKMILYGLPWKLVLFVPLQLALLVGLWTKQSWFKRAFLAYLLLDVLYYAAFTLSALSYGIYVGLIVSLLALLLFLPYFLRK
ncbi:MAG TPA: hypothetical protein DCS01_04860 [Idiomarina abyssalis]|uniref:hypothetical protein n=1 Tax=Idiomarina TaxID=135575 RepID=UPI000C369448|nr:MULTISPECIES: hypothetical protein [Idiomarina]MAB22558.1 hypothetical protein [Idiomarina sp.]MBH93469.1 hypothetical protein [Idiomarina sp.]HAS14609.1 hypothetical protein [Idiomarina abyssalis]|tara:strand:- start:1708 stop:2460 length:753 start_codon:yes stop_codon:yes gene_type:complete